MTNTCEACELVLANVEEPCDGGQPYRVCDQCHSRLTARALRPREWFNLAKTHGPGQFLLHDDFYGEDGTAYQPETNVKNADQFPIPALSEVQHDLELLLDFTITRWGLQPEVKTAWQTFDKSAVLQTLERRYAATNSIDVQSTILQVASFALMMEGQQFVTAAWADFREPRQLFSLATATNACIPLAEGFPLVASALSSLED